MDSPVIFLTVLAFITASMVPAAAIRPLTCSPDEYPHEVSCVRCPAQCEDAAFKRPGPTTADYVDKLSELFFQRLCSALHRCGYCMSESPKTPDNVGAAPPDCRRLFPTGENPNDKRSPMVHGQDSGRDEAAPLSWWQKQCNLPALALIAGCAVVGFAAVAILLFLVVTFYRGRCRQGSYSKLALPGAQQTV